MNSARNGFQGLVTQVQARGHCPPKPCVVLWQNISLMGLFVLKPWGDLLDGRRRTTFSSATNTESLRAIEHKSSE